MSASGGSVALRTGVVTDSVEVLAVGDIDGDAGLQAVDSIIRPAVNRIQPQVDLSLITPPFDCYPFQMTAPADERLALLQSYQNLALIPKLFQPVIIPLFLRKEMHDHIAKVDYHPPGLWDTLDPTEQPVFLLRGFTGFIGQRIEHSIAGSGANDKVVGK